MGFPHLGKEGRWVPLRQEAKIDSTQFEGKGGIISL